MSGASGLKASELEAQSALFFGDDIWFDVSTADPISGEANYVMTQAGDLQSVSGVEALRQSLIRRWITNPGEMPTAPEYGAGLRSYVKAKNTPAMRAEVESRVRAQTLRDPRVLSVALVTVARLDDGSDGIKISAQVTPKGRLRDRNLTVTVEIR